MENPDLARQSWLDWLAVCTVTDKFAQSFSSPLQRDQVAEVLYKLDRNTKWTSSQEESPIMCIAETKSKDGDTHCGHHAIPGTLFCGQHQGNKVDKHTLDKVLTDWARSCSPDIYMYSFEKELVMINISDGWYADNNANQPIWPDGIYYGRYDYKGYLLCAPSYEFGENENPAGLLVIVYTPGSPVDSMDDPQIPEERTTFNLRARQQISQKTKETKTKVKPMIVVTHRFNACLETIDDNGIPRNTITVRFSELPEGDQQINDFIKKLKIRPHFAFKAQKQSNANFMYLRMINRVRHRISRNPVLRYNPESFRNGYLRTNMRGQAMNR